MGAAGTSGAVRVVGAVSPDPAAVMSSISAIMVFSDWSPAPDPFRPIHSAGHSFHPQSRERGVSASQMKNNLPVHVNAHVRTHSHTFPSWFFALRRDLVRTNPAAAVEMPRREDSAPGIHTPAQVRKILESSRAQDPDVCRLLAVQYFAGLRPAEAARITDADIAGGFVKVSGTTSKTRQRRLVTIQPALEAWLGVGGSLPVLNRVRRYYRVRAAAGVPWSHDVTRHTFVSYHLAHFRSAAGTAMEAGHSESILFRHYREVVTPAAAADFWAIRPDPGG